MSVTILELDRVAKSYGKQHAVSEVSLAVAKGEFVALMGPSGCGKTTTLRMIAGLETPTSGEIRLWGRSVNEDAPWNRDTPLVWQSYALFPFMTVQQNVEFGLKQRSIPSAQRAAKAGEWLERMGISAFAARMPSQLSGGQRQRVALARALATEPELLLLDEPLSALDPHLKVTMQTELVRLHRELGITFVCVTHSHSEAFAMADRVVIMNKGLVQQVGVPRDIHRRAENRFVAQFLGGSNIVDVEFVGESDDGGTVMSAFGPLQVSRQAIEQGAAKPGQGLVLVVGTDRVSLSPEANTGLNEIAVRVATLEVAGATITVIMEAEGGALLRGQFSSRDLEANPIAIGDRLHARWDPKDGYFVKA